MFFRACHWLDSRLSGRRVNFFLELVGEDDVLSTSLNLKKIKGPRTGPSLPSPTTSDLIFLKK